MTDVLGAQSYEDGREKGPFKQVLLQGRSGREPTSRFLNDSADGPCLRSSTRPLLAVDLFDQWKAFNF